MTARLAVGAFGEEVAAGFLASRGARVVGRNVRHGHREADLLVELDGERVIVEVKTMVSRLVDADPVDWLSAEKLAHLDRLRNAFGLPVPRLDFVGVTLAADGVTVRWLPGIR
ncbi:MAG TPA: YraN family protein [Acidimicrobiia bacterium]